MKALAIGVGSDTWNALLSVLALVGLLRCLQTIRRPMSSLALALFAGEVLSSPLVFISHSDHRVLAATVGGRFLLAAIGVTWLLELTKEAASRMAGDSKASPTAVGGSTFEPAAVSIISFGLTWLAMGVIAMLGRGSRQSVQIAGAR
jgi:hypothetical protein